VVGAYIWLDIFNSDVTIFAVTVLYRTRKRSNVDNAYQSPSVAFNDVRAYEELNNSGPGR